MEVALVDDRTHSNNPNNVKEDEGPARNRKYMDKRSYTSLFKNKT